MSNLPMVSRAGYVLPPAPIAGCLRNCVIQRVQQALLDGYFVTWPGELDLAPDAMHQHIKDYGEWLLQ